MQVSDNTVATAAVHPAFTHDVNIPYILGLLRRNWLFPVIGCLFGTMAALTYIAITPALYKSSARILIDRSVNRYFQANKIFDAPVLEDAEAASQVHILSSESIVVPVVRSMNLARDPEFVGRFVPHGAESKWSLTSLISRFRRLTGLGADASGSTEEILERIAVETFLKRLTVHREDVPSVINVSFSSEDAKKAADIANAVADRYLATNYEAKSKSTKMASQLLQERLVELKQQAAEAERILHEFKTNNSRTTGGKLLDTTDLATGLNAQLSLARAAMADAKARLDFAQQRPQSGGPTTRVIDNEVVLRLRGQLLESATQLAELESRVGPNHSAALKLRKRMDDLRAAIQEEQRRIASTYMSDYQLAKARSEELTATLSELAAGTIGPVSQTKVTMRELENAAETLRKSYSNVLQRFNEASMSDDVVGQDARIITRAAPPLLKTSRKGLVALGGGIVFGLLLGMGAGLGREFVSGVIRTPEQARELTQAYCVVLPRVSVVPERRWHHGAARKGILEEYVLDAPFSRFTEAFRHVRALLLARQEPHRGNVVCVVSPVSRQGKTTVTTNLAAILASSSDQRILAIDGDLHRRSLTNKLAPQAGEGLIEALDDPSRLPSLVVKQERSGLDLLPCPLACRLTNAAQLLGSPKMHKLLNVARETYDFIVIEAPPIMSVVDVKMIEREVDQFVLVVEWGVTKRRLVLEAMLEVEGIHERLSCVILNKVDISMLRRIESYKGSTFGDYYEG